MFIARRELMVPGETKGTLKRVKPGDEVVGFEKWGEIARRANLNLGWIEEVSDSQSSPVAPEAPAPATKKAAKKKTEGGSK